VNRSSERWVFFLLFAAFLILCFSLLVAPDQGPWLLLLMGALVVAVGGWVGSGVAALLILLSCFICLSLWSQWPVADRPFLLFSVPQLWGLWFFLNRQDQRMFRWRYEQELACHELEKRREELRREIELYRRRSEEVKVKSAQRQHLASCARDLGSRLDAGEIQTRLLDWTRRTFPDAHGVLAGLLETDPADAWVIQRRQALLCDDVPAHPVFRRARVEEGTRSLLVAPLWAESRLVGGLRVESPEPKRFGRDDLRVLDALATMASLAMDNALLYRRIEQAAVRDGLTGLLTHKAFGERMEEELLRAGRYRYPVTLMMIDVDFFKKVNDTYGHAAGDEVLRRLSALLDAAARPVDVTARYGGEEFCLLWVEMDRSRATEAADSLREALKREVFRAGDRNFGVTLSAGVASFPDEASAANQLVRLADQRLYAAKTQGRDRVVSS
jgi:diguanylate cyclase (GGDEF)-like protein